MMKDAKSEMPCKTLTKSLTVSLEDRKDLTSNETKKAKAIMKSDEHAKESQATHIACASLKQELLLSLEGQDYEETTTRTNESMNGDLSPEKLFEVSQAGRYTTCAKTAGCAELAQFTTMAEHAMMSREPKSELLDQKDKLITNSSVRALEKESDEN